ncbi:unnamed protein product [Rhizopus microsporus]
MANDSWACRGKYDIHTTPVTNEESDGQITEQLEHATTSATGMHQGTLMVAMELPIVEREEHLNARSLWMQSVSTESTTFQHIWTLDTSRSTNVDQLERAENNVPYIEDVSSLSQHADTDSN